MAVQQVAAHAGTASTIPFRAPPPEARPVRHSRLRRRQIGLALAALTAGALLAAFGSGAAAAWWVVLGVIVASGAYLALWHHVRQVLAEREFAALLVPGEADLSAWPHLPAPAAACSVAQAPDAGAARPGSQTWALARFVAANLAGWALSPIVFGLTLLLREQPRDTTGQRWLSNLQTAQQRLREQSLRTIAISAATTASVTAAGTVAAFAGTGVASAVPLPTSATLLAGPGLPNAAPTGATYRVAAGDTLGSIAARFGTTAGELVAANHLTNPNLIFVGQLLTLAGGGASAERSWGAPAGANYRVAAGDTLGSIAARFGTTVAELTAINHLADPNLIVVGQVLALRPGAASGAAAARPAPPAPNAVGNTSYRVAAGDTLGSIAARFGTTVAELVAVNHLTNPNLIFVGEMVTVRGGHAPAAAAAPPTARPAPTPAPGPAPAPATSAAATATQVVLQQVGKPYQWAGAGPGSFDCSGLVMYAWAHAGVSLPHYTVSQYADTTRISRAELQPGDLVFYDTGAGAQPGHVTMYIGNGQIVTADSPGTVVRVEVIDWDGVPMGYGRVR